MRTHFNERQLQDPRIRAADGVLRACVHCGFCLATCPTYLLSGDELESPRGRIYLIKEMLEKEQQPSAEVVRHIDSCLSCLSCMTTCPSGVNYMHLIDEGRARIEERYRRPLRDRLRRRLLAALLPYPRRFYRALRIMRPVRYLLPLLPPRLRRLARLSTTAVMQPQRPPTENIFAAAAPKHGALGLLAGCVQRVTDNDINAASIRVLNRLGYDVHILAADCCGAIEQHLGRGPAAQKRIAANVRKWRTQIREHNLEALIVNASGCGTLVKDYGHLLANEPALSAEAADVSALCRDISEFLLALEPQRLQAHSPGNLRVACQNPCSMQHGQGLKTQPARLLEAAGYRVVPFRDDHLCCGSAGTYNLLQPDTAEQLGRRKTAAIAAAAPDVIASGNLGCMAQMAAYTDIPIVHTVQLLDRAWGGPDPLRA